MKYRLSAALALLPGLAMAAAPRFLPLHDTAATYVLTLPGHAAQTVTLHYSAASQRARIDGEAGLAVLANLPAGRAQILVPALHAAVRAPEFSTLATALRDADQARFTPLGRGHYAGLNCETYRINDPHGSGTACLTPDGVVLHFSGHDIHGSATLTAIRVSHPPQPASLFTLPAGYGQIDLPPGALAAILR